MRYKGVVLLCLAAFLLRIIPTFSARASAQVQLGTVDTPTILAGGCPTNRYFYSDPKMVCYTTTVRSCPNADPLDLVYGVDQPAAAPTYNGTIVMFAGDGGTYAGPENGAECRARASGLCGTVPHSSGFSTTAGGRPTGSTRAGDRTSRCPLSRPHSRRFQGRSDTPRPRLQRENSPPVRRRESAAKLSHRSAGRGSAPRNENRVG